MSSGAASWSRVGRDELHAFLVEIGQPARDELLLGLQAPPEVRASIILECFRSEATRDLGEFLQRLERDPVARAEVIQALRQLSADG